MDYSTRNKVAIVIGVLLALPPYAAIIAALLGARLNDGQQAAAYWLFAIAAVYWFIYFVSD